MTVKKAGWQRSFKSWAVTSSIFPFLIFAILTLFEFTVDQKLIITVTGSIAWLCILLPFLIADWDGRRRERMKEICRGDALLKLWKISIDIKDDGSSVIKRKIEAINYADKREFYELESWTDPERNSVYESRLKETRKMTTTVYAKQEGRSMCVCKNGEFRPDQAYKVNRIVHTIPVARGTPLKPYDKFEITFIEQTEENTWKLQLKNAIGDTYRHRVRHVTEKLQFELILPKEWDFPTGIPAREKRVIGEVKDPSCGKFDEIDEKPKIGKTRGRWKIVWEIDYPKLLNTYKLTYHSVRRTG